MIRAYKNRVLVKLKDASFDSSGPIILPTKKEMESWFRKNDKRQVDQNYTLHIEEGEVVSVGDGVSTLSVGDAVIVNKYNGEEFEWQGDRLLSIHHLDIPAKLNMV